MLERSPSVRCPLPILVLPVVLAGAFAPSAVADPGGPPARVPARAPGNHSARTPNGSNLYPNSARTPSARPAGPRATFSQAPPRLVANRPEARTLIREGPVGRLLLGGTWYFRLDDAGQGERLGFARQRSLRGWRAVTVPHNWNAQDFSFDRSSHGWYRRELVLPSGPRKRRTLWVARFEGVSHHATVYLNGREIGHHSGGYMPFEVDLRHLRPGRNRLVVRVSTLRSGTDLTHWRRARTNGYGTGGWWNFGGLSREVYVRPVRRLDVERVSVLPRVRCTGCGARVEVRTLVRNTDRRAKRVRLTLRLGTRVVAAVSGRVGGAARRELIGRFTIHRPKLWQLGHGGMYGLSVTARAAGGARAGYRTAFGIRTISKRADGRVLLNGTATYLLGVSLHEDDPKVGAAWRGSQRAEALRRLDELGATVVRAHYPLHPAMLEALDRRGILVWSGAPVFQVPERNLVIPRVRRNAVTANREMVLRDRNHPSILAWSIANELPDVVGPGQAAFIRAATRQVRSLDTTRLVAIDRATRAGGAEGDPAVRALDALGVNEYFGWYRSAVPGVRASTDADLGPQLDRLHAAYPGMAMFITEFGAESNRSGPVTEKGTFDFQTRFTFVHLFTHHSRAFVNGSIIWVLRDFRVHPSWAGGNPRPNPPFNNKGLLEENGTPKPAFYLMQRLFSVARGR